MNAWTGPAILAVSKGPQSQFGYCLWYRNSNSTAFDVPDTASSIGAGFARCKGLVLNCLYVFLGTELTTNSG